MNPESIPPLFRPATACSLVTSLASLALLGCASTYQFSVDTIRTEDLRAHGSSYRLELSPAVAGDPAAREIAKLILADVRTALSSKGMFDAPEGTAPALRIDVDFGLDGPEERMLTRTEPVYVPVATSSGMRPGGGGSGSSALPQKIGDRTVTRVEMVYRKFLRVTARPAIAAQTVSSPGRDEAVWSILVTNEDESADLGRYARLMTAAAMDLIGQDMPEAQQIVLTDRDGRVVFIERGLGAADATAPALSGQAT